MPESTIYSEYDIEQANITNTAAAKLKFENLQA
jgi:hypothetical protein